MQGVSFLTSNKEPDRQGIAPPCMSKTGTGLTRFRCVDPRTTTCLTPPRPVLACKSSDGTQKNQTCKDEGPRRRSIQNGGRRISTKVIDFLDRNGPEEANKPFFVWYNPARITSTTMLSPKYEAMIGEPGGKDWASTKPA